MSQLRHLLVLPGLIVALASACGDNTSPEPPALDEPDYARAFPQDRVGRLDITLSAADWDAMRADMTDLLGEFGAGMGGGGPGGGGMQLPPELFAACVGLAAGEVCSATVMGMQLTGMCTQTNEGLACLPEGGIGDPGGGDPGGGLGGDLIGRTPIFVECTVNAEGETWEHVGMRFKGNSSLSSSWTTGIEKMPLRLKFDEFEEQHPETEKQRFFGFRSLSLSNGWSDPSLVRDKLGTDIFGDAGLDVPATAFYRVFIDHGTGPIYFGLYTATEMPQDKAFLRSHFDDDEGNLYKPEGTGATFAVYDEATLGKENNESDADFSDVRALFDALHASRTDAAAWRAGVERWLDVDGFLNWLAVNTVIQDWDTYGRMSHNFYLFARADHGGRLQWIPWDHTFAFNEGGIGGGGMGGGEMGGVGGAPLSLQMSEVTVQWPLIRYLLDDPTYRAAYDAHVAAAASIVYEPERAKTRFSQARSLIEPFVVGPDGEQQGYTHLGSPTAFADAHAVLQAHPEVRAAAVAAYLGR
ncbi:MAG TPA: CotH kinase family protein [Kofleriaceae bacterium]|nr:CotH kinase family protein [Kofleriaceae bacterium]